MSPHMLSQYIQATGNAQNQVNFGGANMMQQLMQNNPYSQNPTKAPTSTPTGGGAGGVAPEQNMNDLMNVMATYADFGPYGGVNPMKLGGPSKQRFINQPSGGGKVGTGATNLPIKPFGQATAPNAGIKAAQDGAAQWAKAWEDYSKSFVGPGG